MRVRLTKTTPALAAGGPCPGDYNVPAAWLHRPRLFIPRTDPQGTGPLIRDVSGNIDVPAKGERMHVHAAHHIPVPHKRAPRTVTAPDTSPDFLFPPTDWTPARCSPLRAGEALDVGECGFIGQIGDVFAILPLAHPLVMMASAAMRFLTPCGFPMNRRPTPCCWQKVITARVPLWRRSRIWRRFRALALRRAACNRRSRREPFRHRWRFLAIWPNALLCRRLSDRMPRPDTTRAAPVVVVTAAWWISPRSTVAWAEPGGASAGVAATATCSS